MHAPSSSLVLAPVAATLPPLPQAGSARSDLSPPQRRLLVAAILGLHLAGGWSILQVEAVRESVLRAAPMFVELIAPQAPPAPLTPAQAPPPQRPLEPPPAPAPLIAAPPSPAAAAFVAPAAPAAVALSPPAAPAAVAPAPVPAPPAPAAPTAPPRLLPTSAVQYLEPPAVVYPRLSRRQAEAGLVVVRAYVDVAGGVPRRVQVDQSSGHARLDDAAVAAVQKARFKPYTENGQPVEGWALIPIHFELEQ